MIRHVQTATLSSAELAEIRALMTAAFGPRFDDDDWAHALGGHHLLGYDEEKLVAHAAVVGRTIHIGLVPVQAGYVEAVAVHPEHQGKGYGYQVMEAASDIILEHFEFGALSVGGEAARRLYRKLGWSVWEGPTYVDGPNGRERTEEDDGGVMVLAPLEAIDVRVQIVCDWRPGDVW
jgi:aminoglycoside 2'-N-acetyltransferase I